MFLTVASPESVPVSHKASVCFWELGKPASREVGKVVVGGETPLRLSLILCLCLYIMLFVATVPFCR